MRQVIRAGGGVRIGSSRERIARPASFNERAQADANASAKEAGQLSGGEVDKVARPRSLELMRQPPAEKSLDERSVERT
jgi:hypothetical protein